MLAGSADCGAPLFAMAFEHFLPPIPLPLPELLSLLRRLGVVSLPVVGVCLPTFGGRFDRLRSELSHGRAFASRDELSEALLHRRQAAVAAHDRRLDGDVANPKNRTASLALEAHVSFGQ